MAKTYKNPLVKGGDPFILTYGNKYYLYATNSPDGFLVYESEDLTKWEEKGFCLHKGEGVLGDRSFWAPEITVKDGKLYMVYVANEHLAVAVSDSPLGPFKGTSDKWLSERPQIDGHFFTDDDGTTYLYYVRFDHGNVLYVAKMSDDLTKLDEEHEKYLFRASGEWELRDCSIEEGPFMLKHNGKYYLTYSANHTRSPYYGIGVAVSDKPTEGFVKYEGNPILIMNERVVCVGHHSFTRSRDGKKLLCVYHGRHLLPGKTMPDFSKIEKPYEIMGEYFTTRMACVDEAEFVKDPKGGADILVIHGPSYTEKPAL